MSGDKASSHAGATPEDEEATVGRQQRAPHKGIELTASRFRQQRMPGVYMTAMANGCATRTYTSTLWHSRCGNHRSLLLCT
jgi:hypothetical protein